MLHLILTLANLSRHATPVHANESFNKSMIGAREDQADRLKTLWEIVPCS
jgi:hypothetical protein